MRGIQVIRSAAAFVCSVVLASTLSACKGPDETVDAGGNAPIGGNASSSGGGNGASSSGGGGSSSGGSNGATYTGPIALSLTSSPTVSYDASNGKTTVVVQYSARGANNLALAKDQYTSTMLVNDAALDNESLLDSQSQELAVNLHFSEVLDASYSMTQHNPPAFEPMKKAAGDTLQGILNTWSQRTGNVTFQTIWFAEKINQSINSSAAARVWQPADLLTLPVPDPGSVTKLYAATQKMAELMKADYDRGIAANARDHHVMLVFSDGKDNYSWFGNESPPATMATSNGASFLQYGVAATDLENVKAAITAHPRLTVHVIGVGSDIDAAELQQIADTGKGVFLQNPSSTKLSELFNQVLLEFTTLQTEGALIPLPPGDYEFALVVKNSDGSATDEQRFRVHAGDTTARVLP